MIWLARIALRLAARVGLRWMVVAALARIVIRGLSRGALARATAEIEATAHQRLPAPVARAVSALPPEVRNAGASVVLAGRAARTAVSSGRRATRMTRARTAQVTAGFGVARQTLNRIQAETDASARRLRARYLRATAGSDASTDSLLDARTLGAGLDDARAGDVESVVDGIVSGDPHQGVAGPISPGRRRARPRRAQPVNRPRRGYRPPPKAWD